ncbi:PREDICTED: transcriptional activator DEMETER isoform X2 [Tarenaya hassleriana]|uniref:transcriptional activator DEMETER isoform X1 n=1 Tax=Tarenaya hassleriana TaxID=28532 RepID=UPI00053C49E6|nr:PREDICTED: transcriptional activator DEMETER isoform X1 [Tarenaya hassleriana]XP_010543601.1 PREDICTED: transcriptional activator DEMETER isoform X2 [Tarenaya hassleriana]
MNSRADPRDGGFQAPLERQVQQEFQFMGSWIPITPTKPVINSSLITGERDMNQIERVRCLEPNGFPVGACGYRERSLYINGAIQDLNQTEQRMSRNGGYYHDANSGMTRRSRLINCIAGSYAQTRNNNGMENLLAGGDVAFPLAPIVGNSIQNVHMVNGNATQDSDVVNSSFTQIGNSQAGCSEFELDDLLFSNQIPFSFTRLLSSGDNLCQTLQCGNSASNRPLYNLNSPPRGEANGSFSAATFQSVPLTPNQANNIENGSTNGSKFLMDDNFVQENGFLAKRVTAIEQGIIPQNSDRNIQNIEDFTVVDSTATDEQRQNEPVIDLNQTPQLKPPKRKKYMPKVVKEKKPQKKMRKPATPANAKPKETGIGKRKQAQKTSLKESAIKEPDTVRETSNPSHEIPAKSCRRVLNFDMEKTGDVRQGDCEGGSNSVSEARVATRVTNASCMDSVKINQNVGLLAQDQPVGVSTGNQPSGFSKGRKLDALLPTGEKQPELPSGNQPARLLARDERPEILIGKQQPRFLIGRQQYQFPVATQQSQFPTGNQQPNFPMENRPLGSAVGMQRSFLPMENQQPRLLMGNQQLHLLVGNQQPAHLVGNQQSGYLAGNGQTRILNQQNHQACLATANRPYELSIGRQQQGLPSGQQPGLLVKNQQPERQMRNLQPGSSMRNQQPGLPVMNQHSGNLGGITSHLNKMAAAYMSSPGAQADGSRSQPPATNLHAEILKTISRSLSARTAGTCQRSSTTEYSSLEQNIHQESGYMKFQKRCNGEPLDICRKAAPQNIPPQAPSILSETFETRGSKREYDHAMGQMQNHDLKKTLLQQIAQSEDLVRHNRHIGAALSESSKKMKIQKGFPANMHAMPREVTEVEDAPNDGSQQGIKNVSTNQTALKEKPFPIQSSANNEKCVIVPPTPPRKAPAVGNQLVAPLDHASQVQTLESAQAKKYSSSRKAKEKHKNSSQDSGKTRGPSGELLYKDPVEDIIYRLLNLSLGSKTRDQKEQNALVLYRGDGAVIPYEVKKRKPRPKVDLDEETTRIWNLLMEKGESEGDQEMDKEKEKWWEEERRVFRGRADSFIARMHLVQGDRRFSPWKGSVVDSVIGVFLTQNVTDHLSSSAFMSLAARFPPKANCNQADERNRLTVIVEDPEGCILNLNDTPAWKEKVIENPYGMQASGVGDASKEQRKDSSNFGAERTSSVMNSSQNFEEEVLSSQDSFDPTIFQSRRGVGCCSGSTSELEFSTDRCKLSSVRGSTKSVQIGKPTLLDGIYCRGNGRQFLCEGSDNFQVETTNIVQQEPRTESIDAWKDSLSFYQSSNHANWTKQVLANPSSGYQQNTILQPQVLDIEDFGMNGEGIGYSWLSIAPRIEKGESQNELPSGMRQAGSAALQSMGQKEMPMPRETLGLGLLTSPSKHLENQLYDTQQHEMNRASRSQSTFTDLLNSYEECLTRQSVTTQHMTESLLPKTRTAEEVVDPPNRNASLVESNSSNQEHLTIEYKETNSSSLQEREGKPDDRKKSTSHWDNLRKDVEGKGKTKERSKDAMDSLDYEAIRCASVGQISEAIKERGMNNMLAKRIKEFLDRVVEDHGSIDLEWLRDVPPDKAKDYLLSIRGLGLKSVECVRLLTLHNLAFPVDTNVGRIAVRLGWVPLQPLPESLQLHLLELYPVLESIQKYLWPRLCKLDQRTLYELHYQLITFGKVFCTKSRPNCNACPMRGECRHFASAFASARLSLPAPEERSLTGAANPVAPQSNHTTAFPTMKLLPPEQNPPRGASHSGNCEPIIEVPVTPEQECTEITESDIEDAYYEDPDEIPTIELNLKEFSATLQDYMEKNMELQEGDMSRALVALDPAATSIPSQKLKNISRLRTEHQVYELPDSHPLLDGMDKREPDDPSPYLLAIWTPGETADSTHPPERKCEWQEPGMLCSDETCSACNSVREANSQKVRGTLLIPCRTAMRGSFPLNGTYFQVNEVFADHESSLNPIDVPREWIWNLPRRIVYFGTSVTSIFKGLSTEQIQYCFWKGFVCVRGFDQKTRAPRPLMARLHFSASKLKAKAKAAK